MDTGKLKKFAQEARTQLMAQVSAKLELVLAEGSAARREAPAAVKELLGEIARSDKQQVIEKVAYTWFNRFTALRFMDANGLTNPRVVTPAEAQTRPELLADAAAGHMDEAVPEATRNAVAALLDGRTPSRDAQGEAYRLLLVAACNGWHEHMPFMFEKIRDYSELLMPEDLLSQDSILSRMRFVMADEDCQDVEIIGWLYQFYISEKKDQVFAALKKNVKIAPDDIPAATQLFTPHWIVRYLVENSLGRLWLLNRPQSSLASKMDYYIAPEEPEKDFLRVDRPEDIRICDPACGSGHMLTYAFDLLHAIYEEEGYDAGEIPALILTHNLHGIEIDDRAGALASFALEMKAATMLGRRRFLRLEAKPNICVLQDVRFTPAETREVEAVVGRELFTADLRETLEQFEQARNFGSLIVPKLRDPAEVAHVVRLRDFGGDLLLRDAQERVLKVLEMAEALSPKYHVVLANPPYMGSAGMNANLSDFAKRNFPASKADHFAMFIERCMGLGKAKAHIGMITLPSWLFLSSFERVRHEIIDSSKVCSLLHMGRGNFGIDWGSVAFCLSKGNSQNTLGDFFRLHKRNFQHIHPEDIAKIFLKAKIDTTFRFDFDTYRDDGKISEIKHCAGPNSQAIHYRFHTKDFEKIPGAPFAFWVSTSLLSSFEENAPLSQKFVSGGRLKTHSDAEYVRFYWEVSNEKRGARWKEISHGGDFRRWFGNRLNIVDWSEAAKDFYASKGGLHNQEYWEREGVTCSKIASGLNSFRIKSCDQEYTSLAPTIFPKSIAEDENNQALGILNSKVAQRIIGIINPSMTVNVGDMLATPSFKRAKIGSNEIGGLINLARSDWDAYETSWDFTTLPIFAPEHRDETIEGSYARLRAHWRGMTDEMQRLEEENNRILIDAYGLQDELTPEVPLEDITLTCNPAYRYGGKANTEELEARLCADTMAEFLHYAVGCMFGRYSLDAPGLILANQGEGLADYLARVPEPSFDADADNVIPVLEGDWFADDITGRFRKFLRATFGEGKFLENVAFIEEALGKDIRKWFTRDFFDYHVRRYKKRPIYWMFSSPKCTFNALIYMHRYRPDTVSIVLNDYLRELISKLQAERARLEKLADDASVSQAQRTRALKEIGTVVKQIDELTAWERDVIFPLAQAKIEIDLDDGVKANYPKFGAALKPIKGLDAKEDE